jgi:hypothetical protein
MQFTTKLENENISCYGVPKHLELSKDIEISEITARATVKWSVDIDAREWGIKDFIHIFHSVEAEIELEYYSEDDKDCNNLLTKRFEINSQDFTIVDQLKMYEGYLSPTEIEIDLERKTITIE